MFLFFFCSLIQLHTITSIKKERKKLGKIISLNWNEKCKIVKRGREEKIRRIYQPNHE